MVINATQHQNVIKFPNAQIKTLGPFRLSLNLFVYFFKANNRVIQRLDGADELSEKGSKP